MAYISSSTYPIHSIRVSGSDASYEIQDSRYEEILRRLTKLEIVKAFEFTELSCRNCGATLKQGYLDPIVKCPYCKTVYAVGYKQVNSV